MARRERLGTPIYYASREGVRFDGTDQSAAIQAILDRGQLGPILLVLDGSVHAKGLKLYSGTTVEGVGSGTVITQTTCTSSTDCCVFRNANWVSSYQGSVIVDQDITLRNLQIDGNARANSAGSINSGVTPTGTVCSHLKFHGVNRLTVENVYVYDMWSAFLATNVFGVFVKNFGAYDPYTAANGITLTHSTGSIQIMGPAADVMIDGMWGVTSDDFLAFNACDGIVNIWDTDFNNVFWGGPTVSYYGRMDRLTATNIHPSLCGNALRLLSGTPPSLPIAPIEQVHVSNVSGVALSGGVLAGRYSDVNGDTGLGRYGDVVLSNWTLGSLPNPSSWFVGTIGGVYRSLTLAGFRLLNLSGSNTSQVALQSDAAIGRLALVDYVVREDSSEPATVQPLISLAGGGTVDELVLSGVNWSRNAATATSMVNVAGGTINRIELTNVSANNISHVVNVAGGTVGGVTSTGLVHRNASGGASISQASGTLSRVRAAGSDTALLASGTIGSKKTDSTEDA